MRYANELDLSQTLPKNPVFVGAAAGIEVFHETEKAVLLNLTNSAGQMREVWFPKSALSLAPDSNPVFGLNLFATRAFIGRNSLWSWTAC